MSRITLKQLYAFVAVADLRRFRAAADKLCVTQSAVSVLIKELENRLEVRLFDRHTHQVLLTDAGKKFLPVARETINNIDMAEAAMRDLAHLRTGKVSVASAIVLGATFLPPILAGFLSAYPEISVVLRDVSETKIRSLLTSKEADIGVGTSRFSEDAEIQEFELFKDRFSLFCSIDHPLSSKPVVNWADLQGCELVSLEASNPMQRAIDEALSQCSIKARKRFEVAFSTTLLALVEQGLGVGILPEHSTSLSPKAKVVARPLMRPVTERKVVLLKVRGRELSPAANALFSFLLDKK